MAFSIIAFIKSAMWRIADSHIALVNGRFAGAGGGIGETTPSPQTPSLCAEGAALAIGTLAWLASLGSLGPQLAAIATNTHENKAIETRIAAAPDRQSPLAYAPARFGVQRESFLLKRRCPLAVAPHVLTDRKDPSIVTLMLVDGHTRVGRLARFVPMFPDLALELTTAHSKAAAPRMIVPAEKVAVVLFHADGSRPSTPKARDLESLSLRLISGEQLDLEVPSSATSHPLGFYGFPSNRQYSEAFVYSHALRPAGSNSASGRAADGSLPPDRHVAFKVQNIPSVQTAANRKRATSVTELVVGLGIASPEDIARASRELARRPNSTLAEAISDLRIVSEEILGQLIAKECQLPFMNLDELSVDPGADNVLTTDFISEHRVLPVQTTSIEVTIAISDPFVRSGIDAVKKNTTKKISEIVVTQKQLRRGIEQMIERKARTTDRGALEQIMQELTADELAATTAGDTIDPAMASESDSVVIKLVNQIIFDAYRRGASDIHIEPNGKDKSTLVRFRIDGECIEYQELPPAYRKAMVARIKIMAMLDISEKRKPQDGKIRFRMRDREIELRVATIPTVNDNEDIVLRILATQLPMPLRDIGLNERNLRELEKLIHKPYGLVLCVGPTGSGKTTTLHSMLGSINTVDTKIWTAEDPVEITQPRLRQVQVQSKIGFTFAAAMRAFLRADPDVIMVGEMRDKETASIGIEASLTGHLVMSTLHTNTAPETIVRLIDMGLDPFSFADAFLGVLAQRLVRTLCSVCKELLPGTDKEYETFAAAYGAEALVNNLGAEPGPDFVLWKSKGCSECGGTGYKGRMGIHELLVTNDAMKSLIQRGGSIDELRALAVESGMTTLLQDGVEKSLFGMTDMKQVLSVCSR
jgi:type II secretory ATPase GspE/PulE/Tfp pilus assembly ATPase PilB-like protein